MKNNSRPIGIFDSGVGGLTVVKEVMKKLPDERIVYLGDTARVPYGTKSAESVKGFSVENVGFLMQHGVKLIVVACNTASSVSLSILRKRFRVPIVGVIKPGAKKAVEATKNNKIGIIATKATIKSRSYEKEIKKLSSKAKVISQACPLFVPLAEEGWLDSNITYDVAEEYLKGIIKSRIDTLILGCTHYPLLKDVISQVMGKEVRVIDSASSVAEEVANTLKKGNMERQKDKRGRHLFFVTDSVEQFVKVGERFLGRKILNAKKADVCMKY
ncbi:MAG: glutamate racemase [Candidatus Omnitrophota bacterium]